MRCSRITESVEQCLRDGANVAKLQYVLTVRRAGDLRQLTQLRSFAVCDAINDGAYGLESVRSRYSPAGVDVRVAVSNQYYHLKLHRQPNRSRYLHASVNQCSNYWEDGWISPHCGCGPHVIHGVEVSALSTPRCRPPLPFS